MAVAASRRPSAHPARRIVGLLTAMTVIGGCSAGADVTADELAAVIARDGIAFDTTEISDEVLDRFDDHRVVILGETHHLREHWAFVAELTAALQPRGFGQLLLEAPHMASWLFDDYVQGGVLLPDWRPPPFYEVRLAPIRALNEGLPPDQRVHVFGIDVNEQWYGGAEGFRSMIGLLAGELQGFAPLGDFVWLGYPGGTAEEQTAAVEGLLAELRSDREALAASWGEEMLAVVDELLEVELASIGIRQQRTEDDNAAARAREEIIKQLSDRRIEACACSTLINVGGHHAQKAHLMGTEQEWMGDYLAHRSPAAGGSVFVVGFTSAATELEPGAGGTPWDILDSASPEHEILRLMAEARPGITVFLPLDDPLFTERTVAYNSEDVIYVTALAAQYDALIQYGLAHRMPEN